MDVPAAAALAPSPLPPQPTPAPDTRVASAVPSAAPSPTSGPVPVRSTVGAAPQSAPASNQQTDTTLSPVVAKLFNAAEQNVQVSFQVLTNPDEVVTVFTDKSTGKEIIQFPSQALIALAEMYDKNAGKVLDKSV
jgi:uncharacterized FlaG/YvyC family protein